MRINELIKAKRKEKNLTQQELADKLYLSSKTISKWETGRGLPELAMIPALSSALDIQAQELMNSIQDTTAPVEKIKDIGLNNAILISSAVFALGVLSMAFSVVAIPFLVFGLMLMVTAIVTYFVMENLRSIKIGFQRNDTINKYRKKIYLTWYGLIMLLPLYLILQAIFTPGAVVLVIVPIIIIPTLLFILAYTLFIKK